MTTLDLIREAVPGEISRSPAQIAKVLNCHQRSVLRGLADGSLPLPVFSPTPNRKRVLIADLVAYLELRALHKVKKRGRPVGSRNKNNSSSPQI